MEIPVKVICDLSRSAMRELAMSGTFEEAREAYQKFYSLDFRKYGVDIPPRLTDVKNNLEALNYTGKTLSAGKDVEKDLIQYKEGSKLKIESKPQQLPNQGIGIPKIEDKHEEEGEHENTTNDGQGTGS